MGHKDLMPSFILFCTLQKAFPELSTLNRSQRRIFNVLTFLQAGKETIVAQTRKKVSLKEIFPVKNISYDNVTMYAFSRNIQNTEYFIQSNDRFHRTLCRSKTAKG